LTVQQQAAAMRPPSSWSSRPPVQKSIGARIRDLPAELQVEILSWFDCHILRQLEEHTFKPLSVIKGSENHFQQKVLRSRFATEVSFLYKDLTHYTTVYPGLFSTVVRPVDCLVELQMWQDTTYAVLDRAIEVFHLDESVEAYRKYYRVLTSLYLFKHSPINVRRARDLELPQHAPQRGSQVHPELHPTARCTAASALPNPISPRNVRGTSTRLPSERNAASPR